MSWQEELRNLDEELASGRLSADDYRIRRDRVLSSAVAYGDTAQPQQPATPPQPDPAQPQYQQQPPAQQPQGSSADSTQIIAPVSPPQPSAEATQIVSSADVPAGRTQFVQPWQQAQPADPNRTQVVHSPAGGFPQPQGQGGFPPPQQNQPWNAPEQDLSPPWGGSEFPPIAPTSSNEWVKQGPEVFSDRPSRGKGGKIVLIALIAILVLGGLGVGGYFLFGKKDGSSQAGGSTPSQTQAPAPPPPTPEQQLLDKIPQPTGNQDPKNGVLTPLQLATDKILTQPEAAVLTQDAIAKTAWRGSQKQPDEFGPQPATISVLAIPTTSTANAATLAQQLQDYQSANGFILISDPLPGMPAKLVFMKNIGDKSGNYRALWISGNNVLRIDVGQTLNDKIEDEKALSGSYQRAVKQTLENFPVTN